MQIGIRALMPYQREQAEMFGVEVIEMGGGTRIERLRLARMFTYQ